MADHDPMTSYVEPQDPSAGPILHNPVLVRAGRPSRRRGVNPALVLVPLGVLLVGGAAVFALTQPKPDAAPPASQTAAATAPAPTAAPAAPTLSAPTPAAAIAMQTAPSTALPEAPPAAAQPEPASAATPLHRAHHTLARRAAPASEDSVDASAVAPAAATPAPPSPAPAASPPTITPPPSSPGG